MAADVSPLQRVLVVDDSEPVTSLVASWLADLAAVAVAHNGGDALQQAATFKPHVLLVDIVLPQLSGFDVVSVLQREGGQRPQIIFITGLREPANAMRASELGAMAVLYKPLDAEQVRRAVREALHLSNS